MSVKIIELPAYTGPAAPAGYLPITYAGTTYKIPLALLVRQGTGSGSMNNLSEFFVGAAGFVPGAAGSPISADGITYNNAKLATVNGVMVFSGGTLVPNIATFPDAPVVTFIPGGSSLTLSSGFTNNTHILIMTY